MKLVIKILAGVIVLAGLQVMAQNASAQAIRTTVFSENHLPGGYGLRVDLDFDIAKLPVSKSVALSPSIGLRIGYNASIDDPRVRHLLVAGMNMSLRTVIGISQPRDEYSLEAIPWIGFSIDACITTENTRVDANNVITNSFDAPRFSVALCYGPAAGIDVVVGGKMVLAFGIESLFFSVGESGWATIPIATFGLRAGIGYNASF